MNSPAISDAHRAEQQKLHENEQFGSASIAYAPLVEALLEAGHCRSLSDYGAGKCNLRRALGSAADSIEYHPFEPAFPEYGDLEAADLVVSIDFLEHVEPDLLNKCLDGIASITRKLVLLTVHAGPAKKRLSDGRNAHLIQEDLPWWLPKFGQRFDLIHWQEARKGFFVVACPKGMYRKLDAELDLASVVRSAVESAPPRASLSARAKLQARKSMEMARRDIGALWLAARDERTPWYAKVVAGVASFLAISPIDLTPDFIPVVGYLDDIVVMMLGTFLAVRMIPASLLAEFRERAATIDYPRASRGAALIGSFWLAATFLAMFHSSRFFA